MHSIAVSLAALAAAAVVPLCLLPTPVQPQPQQTLLVVRQPKRQETVLVKTAQGIKELEREAYLIGVVMAEMPLSFPQEALKAQAIAARTYTCAGSESPKHEGYDLCTDPACCQGWISEEQMAEKLGGTELIRKARQAVEETADLVLTYDKALIDAVYFSCSGGHTEDARAVWGTDVPYLQAVESLGEDTCKVYASEVRVSAPEFRRLIETAQPETILQGSPDFWIGECERTRSGSVAEILIGGTAFSGTQLRKLFGLRSTLFTLTVTDTEFVFSVRGNGHRVGMSQYGAAAMAAQGATCEEILQHYYHGVTIEKASRLWQ